MTHHLSLRERDLDRHLASVNNKAAPAEEARSFGAKLLPSDRTSQDAWEAEVILTSAGIFLTREDAFDFASAVGSTLLFIEANYIDEHWSVIEPTSLHEALLQYESMSIFHDGPRHDKPRLKGHRHPTTISDEPPFDGPYTATREAA